MSGKACQKNGFGVLTHPMNSAPSNYFSFHFTGAIKE
jgi:hypothetical protein